MRLRWSVSAFLVYCAIAVSLAGPALTGQGSLLPEGFIDRDLLYKYPTERSKLRPYEDPTPMVMELGRERAVASGFGRGRIDTWNAWSGAGAPLWAEQGNPFFPTKLLYFLYPNHVTYMLALAARLVVAALGMFFLARALGLPPLIAIFTGALLEYSGILSAQLAFSATSATYVFPWVLLGAHKLCTERGPGAVAAGSIALGIASLAGHPSFILLVYLGFGAWLLGEWTRMRLPLNEAMRQALLVIAAGAIAFLIAAVGLLPFLELAWHGFSYKNTDASDAIWGERLARTRDVFGTAMFLPSFITVTRDTFPYHWWPWAEGGSIGFAGLLLAVAGARKLREHWGMVLVAVLGLGLTLAPIGLQWLHQLPGVRIILPWYGYSLLVVPLCLAAGFGLATLAAAPRKNLLLFALGITLLGGVAAILSLGPRDADTERYKDAINLYFLHPLGHWKAFVSPAAGVVAVIAYVLLCRNKLAQAAALLGIIALVEAAAIRIPTINFERSVVLRSGPSEATIRLQSLLSGGYWRFVGVPPVQVADPNSGLLFELRDLRSFSALAVRRQTEFLELAGTQSDDPWKNQQWQYPPTIRLPMLSLAAVKYVIYSARHRDPADVVNSKRDRDPAGIRAGLRELDTVGDVIFFENPFALPRFRVVHDVIPVEGRREAFNTLRRILDDSSATAAPEWARRSVIEGIGPEEALRARSESNSWATFESVRVLSEPDPQTIVLEAILDTPGFVIVADTFYPGWAATVDDIPAEIHPANLLFRAVFVPAGQHTIVMKYQSSWLRTGLALSLIGLMLATVLLVRNRAFNRRIRSQ